MECFITNGLPAFEIVGLPDAAVKEARERVRAAIKNSGFKFPVSRITLNLAPADTRKSGTLYDLPILLGILAATELCRLPKEPSAFLGELSLEGKLRPVNGVLPMAIAAKQAGFTALYVPAENAREATLAGGLRVIPVTDVRQLAAHLNGGEPIAPEPAWEPEEDTAELPDFRDVKGQENVKRALEIAAAGAHNVLLVGPPGSGKSMLTTQTAVHPAGYDPRGGAGGHADPLRSWAFCPSRSRWCAGGLSGSPHHTISAAGLTGGGTIPRPGEISLAHKGVLFLDELPEFRKETLEVMRQPLEDGVVTISRASGAASFPCQFHARLRDEPLPLRLVRRPLRALPPARRPPSTIISRTHLRAAARPHRHYRRGPGAQFRRSAQPRGAGAVQRRSRRGSRRREAASGERFAGTSCLCNANMQPAELREFCELDEPCAELMRQAFDALGLTARSYDRIRKVARTIADLDGSEKIQPQHIAEAIQYRTYQFTQN